jgi:His-Xaa-Ser repeat protein HxsA
MKYAFVLPTLLAAFSFAVPTTGLSKDRHHHDSHDYHGYYCPPVYYGSYPSYYRSYPYAYGPSLGFSFYSRPTYSYESTYYRSVPRSNDTDDELAVDVQRALARRGYYRGGIDGDVGPGTRAAIRRYQYEHRLEVTGRIDRSLLRSLGID